MRDMNALQVNQAIASLNGWCGGSNELRLWNVSKRSFITRNYYCWIMRRVTEGEESPEDHNSQ